VSSRKPPWWRAFDRVERVIGRPLEDAAESDTYVNVMVTGRRVQRAITGTAAHAVGGVVGTVLRAANVPTRSDLRRVSRQLTTLTGEVRALAAAQEHSAPHAAATRHSSAGRVRAAPVEHEDQEVEHPH